MKTYTFGEITLKFVKMKLIYHLTHCTHSKH